MVAYWPGSTLGRAAGFRPQTKCATYWKPKFLSAAGAEADRPAAKTAAIAATLRVPPIVVLLSSSREGAAQYEARHRPPDFHPPGGVTIA